jgi:hypothetical protein
MSITAGSVTEARTATGTDGIPVNCDVIPLNGGGKVLNVLNDMKFLFSKDDFVLYNTDTKQIEGVFSRSSVNSWMNPPRNNQNHFVVINYSNGMSIHIPITNT